MSCLSIAQLSTMLAVTKRTVQRRAVCENWPCQQQKGLGGQRKVFVFASLPVDVCRTVSAYIISKHEQMGQEYKPLEKPKQSDVFVSFELEQNRFISLDKAKQSDWVSMHCFAHELEKLALDKDYVKAGLLVMVRLYVTRFGLGKIKGFDMFCQLYNERRLSIKTSIYSFVARVSRITLLRWEKQESLIAIADDVVKDGVQPCFFEHDLQEVAQDILLIAPNITAVQLKNHFKTIYPNRRTPSARAVSSWLKQNAKA